MHQRSLPGAKRKTKFEARADYLAVSSSLFELLFMNDHYMTSWCATVASDGFFDTLPLKRKVIDVDYAPGRELWWVEVMRF